jgi:hypothetical protein
VETINSTSTSFQSRWCVLWNVVLLVVVDAQSPLHSRIGTINATYPASAYIAIDKLNATMVADLTLVGIPSFDIVIDGIVA